MHLEDTEAGLLRSIIEDVIQLLSADAPEADPVFERLFPDAYESPEDARAFRDLVEDELRANKLSALKEMRGALGEVGPAALTLESESLNTWLRGLTDLRLVIGTRLGVTEETMNQDIDLQQESASGLAVLHWLGWIQESMLEAAR
jgi:hypothetical protein